MNVTYRFLIHLLAADGGTSLSTEKQAAINDKLGQLEELGKQQQPRPLDNPDIFGNFNVAYTSTQRAKEQNGQRKLPAFSKGSF